MELKSLILSTRENNPFSSVLDELQKIINWPNLFLMNYQTPGEGALIILRRLSDAVFKL